MRAILIPALASAVGAIVTLSYAAPIPREVSRLSDEERMIGTWDMTVSELSGRAYTKAVWTFVKGKMISRGVGENTGGTEWKITLDPTKTPREINIGNYPGIYEFQNDQLRIIYTLSEPRPTNFDPADGRYYCVMISSKDNRK